MKRTFSKEQSSRLAKYWQKYIDRIYYEAIAEANKNHNIARIADLGSCHAFFTRLMQSGWFDTHSPKYGQTINDIRAAIMPFLSRTSLEAINTLLSEDSDDIQRHEKDMQHRLAFILED